MTDALCFLCAGDFKTFFSYRVRVEYFLNSAGKRSLLSVATVRLICYHTLHFTTQKILLYMQFTHQQMHYLLTWLKVLNLH